MPPFKPSLKAMAREAKSKPKSTPSKKISNSTGIPALSTEFIQDSDMEEEEEDAVNSNSDDDSLPDTTESATNGKLPHPSGSSSSSENETESEDESGSEDDATPEPAPAPKKNIVLAQSIQRTPKEPGKKATYVAPLSYKAPKDFEPVSMNGASTTSRTFAKTNLEGKLIWYFTAPASVQISSIQQISLGAVEDGKIILSNKSSDYGFIQESAEDRTYSKIMVPRGSEGGYYAVSRPLDRILHLQQIVELPGVHNSSRNAIQSNPKATVPAKKPVRQQPKGLRMRFRPIGFGTGAVGDIGSSSESADEDSIASSSEEEMPKAFRKPPVIDSDDQSSSESDVEMNEAVLPLSKPVVKAVSKKLAQASILAESRPKKPKKRKHVGDDRDKAKNSSFTSNIDSDGKELKKMKKRQTESRSYTMGRQL